MQTRMNVYVTIRPRANTCEMYERLIPFNADVIDLGNIIYVNTEIDIREDTIEKVLKICKEYGECSIDAHMVDKKASE